MDNAESTIWTQADIIHLIRILQKQVPVKENCSFYRRIDKINWQNVSFNFPSHSADDCRHKLFQLMENVRNFRILHEILTDILAGLEESLLTAEKNDHLKSQASYRIFCSEFLITKPVLDESVGIFEVCNCFLPKNLYKCYSVIF